MYGLNIVQRGGVSQTYPPYCVLSYRANGQKCPLLKNEQNAEKTAKVFLEALGTRSKKSRFRFAHLWGKWCSAVCPLFGHTKDAAFYCPHFGLLRFTADAYNRPNFGQLPCRLSMGFHVEMCRLHDSSLRRVDKNRSERRVGGHRGIYRTWPDAEHIPPSPHFHTFSSMKHADIYEFGKN